MKNILGFICVILLFGCAVNPQSENNLTDPVSLRGVVQKGPFVSGSKVTIAELSQNLIATGKTFTTTIINDKGEFSLANIPLSTPYVQITVDGFFFNEITGKNSIAPITLFALSDIREQLSINVNILTHLETERVKTLATEGKGFAEAKKQALTEVLAGFYIKEPFERAETFDLTMKSNASHILLAVSSIVIDERTESEITQLLSKISSDIADNGNLDSEQLKNTINQSSISLYQWTHKRPNSPAQKIEKIRHNTINRYNELGAELDLTYFERYVDKNGNKDLSDNRQSVLENVVFKPIINAPKCDTLYFSNEVTLDQIADTVTMWLPSYDMGYRTNDWRDLTPYSWGGSSGNDLSIPPALISKYGIMHQYTYVLSQEDKKNAQVDFLYLNNGLLSGTYTPTTQQCQMTRFARFLVFINDIPLPMIEAGEKTFTLHKGDKLKLAINPYHNLFSFDMFEQYHPGYVTDVPESLFKGKTASSFILIEGKRFDFTVSLAN